MAIELFPKVEAKRLARCEPGELVRLPHRGGAVALVVRCGDERMLVTLSEYGGEPAPRYVPADEWRCDALSYGKDFAVELDQSPETVLVGEGWERAGALTLTGNRLLLAAQPLQGTGRYGTCHADLLAAEMADQPSSPYTAFTKWDLTVAGVGDARIKLVSFG